METIEVQAAALPTVVIDRGELIAAIRHSDTCEGQWVLCGTCGQIVWESFSRSSYHGCDGPLHALPCWNPDGSGIAHEHFAEWIRLNGVMTAERRDQLSALLEDSGWEDIAEDALSDEERADWEYAVQIDLEFLAEEFLAYLNGEEAALGGSLYAEPVTPKAYYVAR
jgi:hypothetical protein